MTRQIRLLPALIENDKFPITSSIPGFDIDIRNIHTKTVKSFKVNDILKVGSGSECCQGNVDIVDTMADAFVSAGWAEEVIA